LILRWWPACKIEAAGYRGHIDYKFKVYTSRQKPQIKGEMHRRAAVEHRMDRNYLTIAPAVPNNTILAAIDYNFTLLVRWLKLLLRLILAARARRAHPGPAAA
jgi:IS5 family transposase